MSLVGTRSALPRPNEGDTGRTGVAHYYRVFVYNTGEQSAGSNEIAATTAGTAPPS
ncbi:MAG: hypothetical protein GW892_32590, partial [Armatimonadetes bacterium]|nr:hypothetical protein [Armatimonadota bacterium]